MTGPWAVPVIGQSTLISKTASANQQQFVLFAQVGIWQAQSSYGKLERL